MPPAARASRVQIPLTQIKYIFAASAGQCAYPGCTIQTLVEPTEFDGAAMIVEIAHIHAYEDNGPRANPRLSAAERNLCANLLSLCPAHHTLIDKQPNTYTAELLKSWKKDHENKVRVAIQTFMPSVSFVELELITRNLLTQIGSKSSDFKTLPPQAKMDKNNLSDDVRGFLVIALAKADVVADFVNKFNYADNTFGERLRDGFVGKYAELKTAGYQGDGLFGEMMSFATGGKGDVRSQAAGLAILGYFFEACEVFEK